MAQIPCRTKAMLHICASGVPRERFKLKITLPESSLNKATGII